MVVPLRLARPKPLSSALTASALTLAAMPAGTVAVRCVGYTGIWKFGYLANNACMPGVTLSLYWARFCAVMVNSGFSAANGSV
ncbi:hypothetical protein D3C80_2031000 [compost metagenome]